MPVSLRSLADAVLEVVDGRADTVVGLARLFEEQPTAQLSALHDEVRALQAELSALARSLGRNGGGRVAHEGSIADDDEARAVHLDKLAEPPKRPADGA